MRYPYPFLEHAGNRESFFRRIRELYPSTDARYQRISHAYNTAKDTFRHVIREDGERYFEHLRAVALILIVYLRVKDPDLIIAALLHDIVEDCPQWPNERVRAEFGDRVADLLGWLSKPSKMEYPEKADRDRVYHARLALAPRDVLIIKLPDRLHNMLTLLACDPEKRHRKVEETKRYYLPLAEREMLLIHELEDALAMVEESLVAPVIPLAPPLPGSVSDPAIGTQAKTRRRSAKPPEEREQPSGDLEDPSRSFPPDCGG